MPFTVQWQILLFDPYTTHLVTDQKRTLYTRYSTTRMLLTENHRPSISYQRQEQTTPQDFLLPRPRGNHCFSQQTSPCTSDADLDLDDSISSSPVSTQSFLSDRYSTLKGPLSGGFDNIPTFAVPREAGSTVLFDFSSDTPLFATTDLMQADSWLPSGPRFSSHHREPSLSSLGSAGPASPYSQNTSNPHIAVNDSSIEAFHALPVTDDFNYQLASKGFQGQDTFYGNYPHYASVDAAASSGAPCANSAMASQSRPKNDRSLLPPPEFPGSHSNRSRPVSVASSVTSDSPLTPSGEPDEPERRRKTGKLPQIADDYFFTTSYSPLFADAAFTAVPKLDRTMTDIYSDELYNPHFSSTLTSASPNQMPLSPNNEVFAQRLQAANVQHLSAVHSPVSAPSRDRSPFQHGSPLAPAPTQDFQTSMQSSHAAFKTAHQAREQAKAHNTQALQQQLARSASIGTPQTISPKDALLEYTPEGDSNLPLFPQQGSTQFDSNHLNDVSQTPQQFEGLRLDASSFGSFAPSQLPSNIQLPQHYPFMVPGSRQSDSTPMSNSSMARSRLGSADSARSDASHVDSSVERPAATSAEGGTYTCTYHGCALRFETPALLQKHKREGHRQAHGLGGPRRPDSAGEGMTSTLNGQAGPHKCERINPSTGKPCNTIFSRPYDLTRHEDTIHNARKQKVRCPMCTDEKTFSRADALTRHYRVCHPEVEFSGKHRRRAGH